MTSLPGAGMGRRDGLGVNGEVGYERVTRGVPYGGVGMRGSCEETEETEEGTGEFGSANCTPRGVARERARAGGAGKGTGAISGFDTSVGCGVGTWGGGLNNNTAIIVCTAPSGVIGRGMTRGG